MSASFFLQMMGCRAKDARVATYNEDMTLASFDALVKSLDDAQVRSSNE
jgi:hypothetical protein